MNKFQEHELRRDINDFAHVDTSVAIWYFKNKSRSTAVEQVVAAGPGSIPGRDKFPGWGFFGGFPLL